MNTTGRGWQFRRQWLALGFILRLLWPLAVGAGGVVTDCTEQALRAAMVDGGVVTFACDGTIFLANTVTNLVDTKLNGSGHQVTISGNTLVRVFRVETNVSFTVVNLAVADGVSRGGSGILNLGGTVTLSGVVFRTNTAKPGIGSDELGQQVGGGAIFNRGGTVTATACSFTGNSAETPAGSIHSGSPALVYGGAVRNEAGRVELWSCAFTSNRAFGGAAVQQMAATAVGDPAFGGAIQNSGTARLALCTFTGNSATGAEGSWLMGLGSILPGAGWGGAIFNQGTLTVEQTIFDSNAARGGNGACVCSVTGAFNGADGTMGAAAYGGAICNQGTLSLARSTLANNAATAGHGGPGGNAVLFQDLGGSGGRGGDGGAGRGGALLNEGLASLVNCTVASNTGRGGAGGYGGAASGLHPGAAGVGGAGGNGGTGFGGVDGTCALTNCTLALNVGTGGAGGAGGASAPGNPGGTGAPGANGSAWGATSCSALPNALIASNTPAGGDSFADPKLGPLAANGGSTPTMALLPGSPAIDAGNTALAPAVDQRGLPRPAGLAADLGAFEYGSVVVAITGSRPDTDLTITARGDAGAICRLLASPDLLNWTPIATNQISADGTVLFHDTRDPAAAGRYYRLVTP